MLAHESVCTHTHIHARTQLHTQVHTCMHTHTYACNNHFFNEAINLKANKKHYMGGFRGRKGRNDVITISKIKQKGSRKKCSIPEA